MKKEKRNEIRKANKFKNEQIRNIFNEVMERQLKMPFNIRWRIALRILKGTREKRKMKAYQGILNAIIFSMVILIVLYFYFK